jgi:nucleotide-binding universal stress UspA family protein
VDFSAFSRHAFERAVAVARTHDAAITVLHVLPMASPVPAIPFGPEGPGPFGLEAVDRGRVLSELPRFLGLDRPVDVKVEPLVIEAPSTKKEIVLQASQRGADLIVMGSHGRSGFERLMLGSVADGVLRAARVPVLIVPSHSPVVESNGREPFRHILYATDFSEGSELALRYAMSLAHRAAAPLTVMHVVEPLPVAFEPIVGPSYDLASYHAALDRHAREKLQTFLPGAARDPAAIEELVIMGRPYVEILAAAADRQVDLIVLGVHGRNALDRLVFGSTAENVVRRATCPVLTVRDDCAFVDA